MHRASLRPVPYQYGVRQLAAAFPKPPTPPD
jgi:hypothetical protein